MSNEEHDEREEVGEDAAEDLEASDDAADDVQGGARRKAGGDDAFERMIK